MKAFPYTRQHTYTHTYIHKDIQQQQFNCTNRIKHSTYHGAVSGVPFQLRELRRGWRSRGCLQKSTAGEIAPAIPSGMYACMCESTDIHMHYARGCLQKSTTGEIAPAIPSGMCRRNACMYVNTDIHVHYAYRKARLAKLLQPFHQVCMHVCV